MKSNQKVKCFSVLMIICMFMLTVTSSFQVKAATPSLSNNAYIKTYVLSTKNNTPVYTSTSFNTRGTASPYKAYNATIYATDEVYVYNMTDQYAYVSYPTSSGRRYGYIRTSAITSNNYSVDARTSTARITTYRRAGSTAYGYIAAGDTVYTTAQSGNYVQVIYNCGRLYKMAWIKAANYNRYIVEPVQETQNSINNTENANNVNTIPVTVDNGNGGGELSLPMLNGSIYIKSYPLSTGNDTPVFTSDALNTRGTASPYQVYNATIYAADEIYIYSMNSRSAYVSYPTSSGRRYGYIQTSAVTANNNFIGAKTSSARITTYRRAGSDVYGYVDTGDDVYTVAQSGGYVQVIYNCGSFYKMGWVPQDQYNAYIGGSSTSIPVVVVNGGSTEEQREQAVNYMRQMATISWTPSKSFKHWSYNQSGGNNFTWTAGTTYYGIPYSQKARETSLEQFRNNMNGNVYVGPATYNTYLGNDCSSAVSLAWKSVNPSYTVRSTHTMFPKNANMRKVGNYADQNRTNATTICNNNGRNKMYSAYSCLQKGDAVLSNDHVMMVTSVSSDKITVIEQSTYKSSLHSTWRVDESYSFSYLYNKGYIPVTLSIW